MRATALAALERMGRLTVADLEAGLADPDATVRRRAAQLAAGHPGPDLVPLLGDEPLVAEMAAWALGERGGAQDDGAQDDRAEDDRGQDDGAQDEGARVVEALSEMAGGHGDPLCREAAVAALGAIGDARGLPAILAATRDKPAVRRRAVLALAPFEGPEVDEALARAAEDRDWQVRQAAEDLTARP